MAAYSGTLRFVNNITKYKIQLFELMFQTWSNQTKDLEAWD